jgi:hypothetical protein
VQCSSNVPAGRALLGGLSCSLVYAIQSKVFGIRTPCIVETLIRKTFRIPGSSSAKFITRGQLTYNFLTAATTASVKGETCAADEDITEIDLFNTFDAFISFWNYNGEITLCNYVSVTMPRSSVKSQGRDAAASVVYNWPLICCGNNL